MSRRDGSARPRTEVEAVGDKEIVITRSFRAPPALVFELWTRPEHVRRWWAPRTRGVEIVECTADVRVGGTYRYVSRAGGLELAFSGTYEVVEPGARLVYDQLFEAMAHLGPAQVTVRFEARGTDTLLVAREVHASREARDGKLAHGMEDGLREVMEQLDALIDDARKDAGR